METSVKLKKLKFETALKIAASREFTGLRLKFSKLKKAYELKILIDFDLEKVAIQFDSIESFLCSLPEKVKLNYLKENTITSYTY